MQKLDTIFQVTVHKILRMGDPRLLVPSEPVADPQATEIKQLIEDMRETMKAYNGAGLAAPQIGVPLRLVIFGGEKSLRYPDGHIVEYRSIYPDESCWFVLFEVLRLLYK